jgi:hypothetical protein
MGILQIPKDVGKVLPSAYSTAWRSIIPLHKLTPQSYKYIERFRTIITPIGQDET